ncbi:DUF2625 domain-containing protein [Bacteroides sp.]|uniref:DUF2625 domain-containing protein n=1 Tax=Bacteroides sp. TaxID=29523 RepID=UPI003AB61623
MNNMRTLEELIDIEDSGWNLIREWMRTAKNQYLLLPKDQERANKELLNAQVTTHSTMGAIIYETGGILFDYGWIRVLGSGNSKLNRGLMEWNKGKSFKKYGEQPSFLLIADDVIGGYFAINAGKLGTDIGKVYYLAPDTMEWENLEIGYSDFIYWLFNGNIQQFYENFKWKTWKEDLEQVDGNQTFFIFPFLWTKEGEDIEKADKKLVPTEENYALTTDMFNQLF